MTALNHKQSPHPNLLSSTSLLSASMLFLYLFPLSFGSGAVGAVTGFNVVSVIWTHRAQADVHCILVYLWLKGLQLGISM